MLTEKNSYKRGNKYLISVFFCVWVKLKLFIRFVLNELKYCQWTCLKAFELDDLFESINNEYLVIFVNIPNVPCVKPTFLVNCSWRGFRILQVLCAPKVGWKFISPNLNYVEIVIRPYYVFEYLVSFSFQEV